VSAWTAGYARLSGDHEPGCARRTIEVTGDLRVDLDDQDRIIGVEMLGGNQDWTAALAALAMQGRLTVRRQVPRA
jgi:uncharacterized protein YuzE